MFERRWFFVLMSGRGKDDENGIICKWGKENGEVGWENVNIDCLG